MSGVNSDSSFMIDGRVVDDAHPGPDEEIRLVSPDYFRVMGMPILRGRSFGSEEIAGRPRSVIIDESFAKKVFPNADPIGQHLDDNQSSEKDPPPVTIVGVVPRTRNEPPGEENVEKLHLPQVYFCATQFPQEENSLLVKVASGDPLALAANLQELGEPGEIVTEQQLIPAPPPPEGEAIDLGGASYEFEPDEETILARLLPQALSIQLYRALLESAAGEHGARMTAMDNATRNAGDMIKRLTLNYNRARQANITKELIEIISGAEAV
jgi:hypothetical protein